MNDSMISLGRDAMSMGKEAIMALVEMLKETAPKVAEALIKQEIYSSAYILSIFGIIFIGSIILMIIAYPRAELSTSNYDRYAKYVPISVFSTVTAIIGFIGIAVNGYYLTLALTNPDYIIVQYVTQLIK